MKNIYYFSLLLIVTSTTFCMHTKLVTTNKFNRTHILTTEHFDLVKSRREAYQKYCPVQINWDLPSTIQAPHMEPKPDTSKKNDFGYWTQYTKK